MPPSNGGNLGLVSLVSQVLGGPTTLAVQLDSLILGQSGNTGIFGASPTPQPNVYWFTSAHRHAERGDVLGAGDAHQRRRRGRVERG